MDLDDSTPAQQPTPEEISEEDQEYQDEFDHQVALDRELACSEFELADRREQRWVRLLSEVAASMVYPHGTTQSDSERCTTDTEPPYLKESRYRSVMAIFEYVEAVARKRRREIEADLEDEGDDD